MKKQIIASILVICIGLAFGFISPVTAEAAAVKLTYSNFFPPRSYPEQAGRSLVQGS